MGKAQLISADERLMQINLRIQFTPVYNRLNFDSDAVSIC